MAEGRQQTLDNITILAEMSPEDRATLAKNCAWREVKRREQIIDRDQDSGDVYFVVAGGVRVVNFSMAGREVSYADVPEGGVFGETAAIDGKPRSASIVALKATTVASLSRASFRRMVQEFPDFSFAIMQHLVALLRGSTDRILDLSTLGAYNRVYAELLRLARDTLDDEYQARVQPVPVHSALASRCGTTRETVARSISDLIKKGVAEKDGNALVFPDLMVLEELVEGDDEV